MKNNSVSGNKLSTSFEKNSLDVHSDGKSNLIDGKLTKGNIKGYNFAETKFDNFYGMKHASKIEIMNFLYADDDKISINSSIEEVLMSLSKILCK